MGLRAISHVVIRVDDLASASAWYRDVLGLMEIESSDGVSYLGCGGDRSADIGLVEGGTGLVSFAFSVTGGLERARARLDAAGVACRALDRTYPGVEDGIAFGLPSGHVMEAVVHTEAPSYLHPTQWDVRAKDAPLDLDHLNLHAADVRETARFLVDTLGFRISDVFEMGGQWIAAWCRVGEWHHDIAIAMTGAGTLLHHFSLLTQGIGHHERIADRLARFGYTVEWGIGRHGPGGNLFLYARDPAGNRVELTAEMARIPDPEAPTRVWDGDPLAVLNQWGVPPPPSFGEGT